MDIKGLISAGYVAMDILDMLSNKNPQASKKIRRALSAGYGANQILNYITGDKEKDETYLTQEEKIRNSRKKEDRQLNTAAALGLGALGVGAGALASRGIGAAAAAGAPNLSPAPPPVTPPAPPSPPPGALAPAPTTPTQNPLTRQNIINQALNPPAPSPVASAPSPTTISSLAPPSLPSQQATFSPEEKNILKKFPTDKFIDAHLNMGKTPEETYEKLKTSKLFKPVVNKFEDIRGTPFLNVINERQKELSENAKTKTPSIKEEEISITPLGAGALHKIHGDDAYVEIDHKLHKVPKEEIEPPSEDLIEAVQNILKIPEIDKSSNVSLFTYDPDESKMYIQFHDGSTYKYLDMDPEVVRKIAEKEAIPITEGKNIYGAWGADDTQSLGAALWKYILKDPKYAKPKKGEPENPYYKKLDTLYDYWEKLRKKPKRKNERNKSI
jgi:hypothetical protein